MVAEFLVDSDVPEVWEKDCVQFFDDATLVDTGKLILRDDIIEYCGRNKTFQLDYIKVSMHGLVKEGPQPHLMIVCSAEPVWRTNQISMSGDEDNSSDNDEDGEQLYLKFAPQSESELDELYATMCAKMSLHPDENEDDSDLDDIDENGFDGNTSDGGPEYMDDEDADAKFAED